MVTIKNSIVAGNTGRDLAHSNGLLSIENSLIGDIQTLTEAPVGMPDANGNLIGGPEGGSLDPLLGPLTDNGGPTFTHALLPGSPAFNAGNPNAVAGLNGVPLYDQRGAPFGRVVGGRIDMGALESQPTLPPAAFGDYNLDGAVDAADYVIWRATLGKTVSALSGADGSGNGVVDQADYHVWRSNFGRTLAAGLPAIASAAWIEAGGEPIGEVESVSGAPFSSSEYVSVKRNEAVDLLLGSAGRFDMVRSESRLHGAARALSEINSAAREFRSANADLMLVLDAELSDARRIAVTTDALDAAISESDVDLKLTRLAAIAKVADSLLMI
jgi:hypothetical protein